MTIITNFRSLSGITVTGGRIKDGMLFRGGQLTNLSTDQISYLQHTIKISRVIDLRSTDEKKSAPDSLWSPVDYEWLDILKEASPNNASLSNMLTSTPESINHIMLETYEQLATSHSAHVGYHNLLEMLASTPQPTYFHCFAGKDRTGIAAALILKILGATDTAIFDDYLLSNIAREKANALLLDKYSKQLDSAQLAGLQIALTVKRSYLQYFFKVITHNYKSFNDFLYNELKITSQTIKELKQAYVQLR